MSHLIRAYRTDVGWRDWLEAANHNGTIEAHQRMLEVCTVAEMHRPAVCNNSGLIYVLLEVEDAHAGASGIGEVRSIDVDMIDSSLQHLFPQALTFDDIRRGLKAREWLCVADRDEYGGPPEIWLEIEFLARCLGHLAETSQYQIDILFA